MLLLLLIGFLLLLLLDQLFGIPGFSPCIEVVEHRGRGNLVRGDVSRTFDGMILFLLILGMATFGLIGAATTRNSTLWLCSFLFISIRRLLEPLVLLDIA